MSGHLDLRNDRDEARARVRHDRADVGRRVRRTEAPAVGARRIFSAHLRCGAATADARQFRKTRDRHAPALVVREMPMERVEFVPRREIDHVLDGRHREEMPAHVEVNAAPTVRRPIVDDRGGHASQRSRFAGELFQGLDRVEESSRPCGLQYDAARAGSQPITFGAERRRARRRDELDRGAARVRCQRRP